MAIIHTTYSNGDTIADNNELVSASSPCQTVLISEFDVGRRSIEKTGAEWDLIEVMMLPAGCVVTRVSVLVLEEVPLVGFREEPGDPIEYYAPLINVGTHSSTKTFLQDVSLSLGRPVFREDSATAIFFGNPAELVVTTDTAVVLSGATVNGFLSPTHTKGKLRITAVCTLFT